MWPTYFSKAKGRKVDLDGHLYHDMSLMGVGTNILGYGNQEVDEAVRAISAGNMSTLNCPEEIELAERLLSSILGLRWLSLQERVVKPMQFPSV